jgi:hypothetical protein
MVHCGVVVLARCQVEIESIVPSDLPGRLDRIQKSSEPNQRTVAAVGAGSSLSVAVHGLGREGPLAQLRRRCDGLCRGTPMLKPNNVMCPMLSAIPTCGSPPTLHFFALSFHSMSTSLLGIVGRQR